MKKEFDRAKAVKLGEMYAEEALVATVAVKDTAPEGAMKDFVFYLKSQKVPHEVLFMDDRTITFATVRDPEVDTLGAESRTRKLVAAFFTGVYADAFHMEAYYQKASNEEKMNSTVVDFATVKRSVHRRAT